MKITRIREGRTRAIIHDIRTDAEGVYAVSQNARLELVILGKSPCPSHAKFSIELDEPGARAIIIGLFALAGNDSFSLSTSQVHKASGTSSNLLVKSLADGASVFRYNGGIRVEKKAQKTDAYQRNENLLLSRNAHAESSPMLEILANNVRCTHGAATSSVSKEMLWYMQARGITEKNGTRLISQGFLLGPMERISDIKIRDSIEQFINDAV